MTLEEGQALLAARQTASAASGGKILQAGRDLVVNDVHHHMGSADKVVLVEPVLPAEETVSEVFVGRDTEVDAVLAILDPKKDASGLVVVSAVAGLAGIGKTALARVAATEAVSRGWFPGGAVFVDLDGYAPNPDDRIRPQLVYAPMLHALHGEESIQAGPQAQATQFHRLLADRASEDRAVLLVLDNASTNDQIADLLPRSRKHRVLVTSRHTLTVRGSHALDLGILAQDDAMALIHRQLNLLSARDTRINDAPEAARRLCQLCGHLPLALHIVTALLAGDPGLSPGQLADDLAKAYSRLDLLDDGERAVRAAFDLSYLRLTEHQARLFRLLPVNPGPHFSIETAAHLLDVATHHARPLIYELARAHVIEHAGGSKWRQHDLIRAYALDLLVTWADDQAAPANRIVDHYATKGAAAGEALRVPSAGADSVQRSLAWFDQEQPNLQAAIAMALTFGDSHRALRMLEAQMRLQRYRGQTAELMETCARVVAASGSVHGTDRNTWALAGLAWSLGAVGRQQADVATTEFERLLDFGVEPFRKYLSPSPEWECATLRELLEVTQGAVALLSPPSRITAIPLLHEIYRVFSGLNSHELTGAEALRTAAIICSESGEARLQSLSWALRGREMLRIGRPGSSVRSLEAALNAFPQQPDHNCPDWRNVCDTLLSVAEKIPTAAPGLKIPQHYDMERAYLVAIEAYSRIGDHRTEAIIATGIGTRYHDEGNYQSAVTSYQKAATILTELNRPHELGLTLANLAWSYTAIGDHTSAESTAERASALLTDDGEPHTLIRALEMLMHIFIRLRKMDQVVAISRRVEQVAYSVGRPIDHIYSILSLAQALLSSGLLNDSVGTVQRAMKSAKENDDPALYFIARSWLENRGLPTS